MMKAWKSSLLPLTSPMRTEPPMTLTAPPWAPMAMETQEVRGFGLVLSASALLVSGSTVPPAMTISCPSFQEQQPWPMALPCLSEWGFSTPPLM